MKVDARAQKVFDRIDVDELVKVALDLGNIDSPTGSEGPVGEYVYDWLRRQGFEAQKIALMPDRPNVLGTLPGTSFGRASSSTATWTPPFTRTMVDDAARRRRRLPLRVARGRHARRQRRLQRQGPHGDLPARRQGHQGRGRQAEGRCC